MLRRCELCWRRMLWPSWHQAGHLVAQIEVLAEAEARRGKPGG